jgi:hypothetical protein
MQKFVLARIVAMNGIDIGLFDYDRHNALYFFVLNADEQIYLRYGGRDAEDAMTYLNLESLELALRAGLDRHELYRQGKLAKQPRPAPFYPEQIALLKRNEIDRGRCVECHLIGDYLAQEAELIWQTRSAEDALSFARFENDRDSSGRSQRSGDQKG